MLRKNPTTLIIDSRDRIGPLNYDTFSITVSPPIVDATKVRLLFASIGVPLTSTEPYWVGCALPAARNWCTQRQRRLKQ